MSAEPCPRCGKRHQSQRMADKCALEMAQDAMDLQAAQEMSRADAMALLDWAVDWNGRSWPALSGHRDSIQEYWPVWRDFSELAPGEQKMIALVLSSARRQRAIHDEVQMMLTLSKRAERLKDEGMAAYRALRDTGEWPDG